MKKEFKIGDWVRSKGSEINSQNAELLVKQLKSQIQIDKFIIPYIDEWELWQPKEGEWCWFWDDGYRPMLCKSNGKVIKYFNGTILYMSDEYIYSGTFGTRYCEPFIGELPSFIKEIF